MNIQETIKHLQSSIKKRSCDIDYYENQRDYFKGRAPAEEDTWCWRAYHANKDEVIKLAKQQKIEKSLYKLMLNIAKASPNGSISLYQIREM